jgi:hypothetical protein
VRDFFNLHGATCFRMRTNPVKVLAGPCVLAFLTLLPASKASAEPDYTELRKAVTNFFVVMDRLVDEVPKAKDADAAVKAIDAWATANNGVSDAAEAFLRKNPAIDRDLKPPPEFAECIIRCTTLKTNYVSVAAGVGTLIKQFGTDQKVAVAVSRFQRSVQQLDKLAKMGIKDED